MIEVQRSTTLPAGVLWDVLSDLRGWPSWLPTVDTATPLDPARADGPGAAYVLEQPGLPRATWTVTDWQPGRSFTWESRSPGIRSTGIHELLPTDRGTTIRLALEWTGLLARPLEWVIGAKSRNYVTREAAALEATAAARAGA
ncbi:MAG TPA: SRPBCC family protein [Phycicoccus sp.]|nr:SRPBCC family protein [Phycicoccus sp.]